MSAAPQPLPPGPAGPWFVVRRVRLWPSARLGCVLGTLAGMPLAAAGAAVVVLAIRAVDGLFGRVEPVVLSLAGHEMMRIDLLERLGLTQTARAVGAIADLSSVALVALFAAFVIATGALTGFVSLLVAVGYNLLSAAGLALELEVDQEDGVSSRSAPPG